MKCLITGGSGFIGGYVLRHLRGEGYAVANFDTVVASDKDNIQGSILDFEVVQKAVEESDFVFHFAGFSNINHVKDNPRKCIETNIMGTINLLEALRLKGKGSFCLASSVYVHDTKGHLYTLSKWASELLCQNYCNLYGINSIIIRLGTVYGEQSRHEDVISIFVKNACMGKPIVIHGLGTQTRHFIHGEDVANACQALLEKRISNKTLILAGSTPVSVNALASIIKQFIPSAVIQKREIEKRFDDYEGNIGNLEETYAQLDWRPQVSIEEGVKRLIMHFKGETL